MAKCQNVNCYNGKNCPISQEVHDLVKNQKRKAELKRLEKCFEIIKHEIKINRFILDDYPHRLILLEKFYALKKELN